MRVCVCVCAHAFIFFCSSFLPLFFCLYTHERPLGCFQLCPLRLPLHMHMCVYMRVHVRVCPSVCRFLPSSSLHLTTMPMGGRGEEGIGG